MLGATLVAFDALDIPHNGGENGGFFAIDEADVGAFAAAVTVLGHGPGDPNMWTMGPLILVAFRNANRIEDIAGGEHFRRTVS
jgi:hypothetical protein